MSNNQGTAVMQKCCECGESVGFQSMWTNDKGPICQECWADQYQSRPRTDAELLREAMDQMRIAHKRELAAVTAERDGLQRAYDAALRQMNEAIAKAEWLRTDRVAELERELAEVTVERDALRAELEDIKNATNAAMDESCDCSERHCSCVPLLRAEVKRLRHERDATIKLADDLAETLSDLWHHYSLTGAGYEVVESALAMWKESKKPANLTEPP